MAYFIIGLVLHPAEIKVESEFISAERIYRVYKEWLAQQK